MTACNATCSHGGICTLDATHDGLHSASGYCEWPRGDWDKFESDGEALTNSIAAIMDGSTASFVNSDIPVDFVIESEETP